MKIHSAYLQNQIPDNTNTIRPLKEQNTDAFKEIIKNRSIKSKDNEEDVKLELSPESKRILSKSEKDSIVQLFVRSDQVSTYDRTGKSSTIQLPVGNRIDVKG